MDRGRLAMAILGGLISGGLKGYSASKDQQLARQKIATQQLQSNRTSAQKDYEYMQKLPEKQREPFVQIAKPAPYGYTPLEGGGLKPNAQFDVQGAKYRDEVKDKKRLNELRKKFDDESISEGEYREYKEITKRLK